MIITAVFIHKLLLVDNRYLPILFFLMRFCQLILHYQLPKNNKGQSNLAIGDIARFIMTSDTAHSVDIFYHIRQVAARIAKLVLVCAFGTSILGRRL